MVNTSYFTSISFNNHLQIACTKKPIVAIFVRLPEVVWLSLQTYMKTKAWYHIAHSKFLPHADHSDTTVELVVRISKADTLTGYKVSVTIAL